MRNIRLGNKTRIHSSVYLGDNVSVGDNTIIKPGAVIAKNTIIGANVLIGPNACTVAIQEHKCNKMKRRNVVIGDGAFIGACSVIAGVVNDGCIVGAHSFISEGTETGRKEIWTGCPAKLRGRV